VGPPEMPEVNAGKIDGASSRKLGRLSRRTDRNNAAHVRRFRVEYPEPAVERAHPNVPARLASVVPRVLVVADDPKPDQADTHAGRKPSGHSPHCPDHT